MSKLTHRLVLPLLALLLAVANTFAEEPNRNVRFGLPSPAKTDSAQREDYLIERPQYVLSYNARMLVLKSPTCSLPTGLLSRACMLRNGPLSMTFPSNAGDNYTARLAIVDEVDQVLDLDRLL